MFFDQVEKLCKAKNISPTDFVENELHMSRSNVTKWKAGKVPKSSTVQKIASCFGVSTDYLLGNEQKNKPTAESGELDPKSKEIMDKLPLLTPGHRDSVLALIESLAKNQDKQ